MAFPATVEHAEQLDGRSRALLRAVLDGDTPSLGPWLTLHQRRLVGYFRARSLPEELLPTALSNVFEHALAAANPPAEITHRQWLLQLARAELSRQASRKPMRANADRARLWLDVDQDNPDSMLQEIDTRAHATPSLLESLEKSEREALQMAYRDQHPLAEMAVKLKRSESAVAELLSRARESLFRKWNETERREDDHA